MSDSSYHPYALPEVLKCPNCEAEIDTAAGVTPGHSNQLRKGAVIVCSACAGILVVRDGGLGMMTKPEFEALDVMTKRSLGITVAKLKQSMRN